MESPLVTVFIPVFNCEMYIKESLESILNQTYKNLEILIVDDGSTDNTINIINQYKDDRIKIIKNKKNMGIPYTRNVGLKSAKGKYLAIMDADDISLDSRIMKQVQFLEEHEDIDVVGSNYEIFGCGIKRVQKHLINPEEIKAGLIFFNQIGNPTTMIRMKTLKDNNINYDLECFVAQDYNMWIQISKVGNISIIPEVLLKYRHGHANITKKSNEEKAYKRKLVLSKIHNDILDFYDFTLTEHDKEIFNLFFDDNPNQKSDKYKLYQIKDVLNKIIIHNNKNLVFKREILDKIIEISIYKNISNHTINLLEQIELYKTISTSKNKINKFKNICFITAKYIYRKYILIL